MYREIDSITMIDGYVHCIIGFYMCLGEHLLSLRMSDFLVAVFAISDPCGEVGIQETTSISTSQVPREIERLCRIGQYTEKYRLLDERVVTTPCTDIAIMHIDIFR